MCKHLIVYLLLAHQMGRYCFARCRLLASVVVVCKAAGRVGTGTWTVSAPAAGSVGGQAADTARRASTVTSH